MRLCVFLLLLSHVVSAQIPRGLTSVARIREEIRIPLDNKMIQMRQNFIETPRQGVLIYSADKNIRCPNDNIVFRGEPLLRVVTNEEIHPIKRTIKTYYGCSKNIAYREITVETKSQFRYELLGPDNLSIFSLLRSDRGASAQSEIKLLGNIVYRIQEFSRQSYLEIFYFRYPFRVNFSLNGFDLNFNRNVDESGHYIVRVFPSKRVEFFNNKGERISKGNFNQTFQFRGISYFIDAILQDLPATKFLNAGDRNQKLIQELRNAQTFLLSGTNGGYVRNLINEYIKNAEAGELIDNR